MAPKRELCRNFLRGSCRYGNQCKFLHAAQTPSKSNPLGFGMQNGNQSQHSNLQQKNSNPFGFGVQNGNQFQNANLQQQTPNPFGFGMQNSNQSQHTTLQQQKSNPFGFGVQNNSHSRGGASDFGSKESQYKHFENKWTRPSQTNAAGSSVSRQPDNQSASHKCTDPESCKSQIAEDFQNERPLWKLTCYGHSKNGPCDIVGDMSYEELRAAAYDDAMHGLSLQTIVEKERNLLNSKLLEFDVLLRNPYKVPVNSAVGVQSPFHNNTQNTPVIARSSNPPSFSNFSHLGTSLTLGATSPPTSLFGQPHPFQNTSHASSRLFGSKLPSQRSSSTGLGNGSTSTQQNQFLSSTVSSQISTSTGDLFNGSSFGGLATERASLNLNIPVENLDGDDGVWTKETWTIGKIPESAPPVKYCQ